MTSDLSGSVATILNPAASPEGYERLRILMRRAGYGVLTLFALAYFVSSIVFLLNAWRTGTPDAWQSFWHNPLDALSISPFFLLFRRDLFDGVFQSFLRLDAVRQAAIAGDDSKAPLATEQPASPSDSLLLDREVEITQLMYPSTLHRKSSIGVAISFLTLAFMLGFTTFVLFFVFLGNPDPSVGSSFLVLAPNTVLCIVVGVFAMRQYRQGNPPLTVIADQSGVRWRGLRDSHREQRILWHEAQAFITVHWLNGATATRNTLYALIAPSAVLSWEITERTIAKSPDKASKERRATARALASLVAARTSLPLRDLTDPLEVAVKPPIAPAKPKIRFPLGSPGAPDAVPGIPPAPSAAFVESDPGSSRRLFRLGSLAALAAVPIMLVYGAGFGLQQIQPHYFDALLTQAEAQSPLYLDTLDQVDGDWPFQLGTPSGPRNYFFTEPLPLPGVYQLSGPDPQSDMYAWQSHSFSDAVVEVTTRYPKNATSQAIGGIGLLLRERGDGKQFVEFQVDPWGEWELWDFSQLRSSSDNWHELADGHSTAIHLGVSAINRVAVLMRGNHFLLYANGAFLGAATDESAPTSGPAGVYVNNDSPGGQFSDFAVYPLSNSVPYLL